jgi:HSP20 family protein
MTMEFKDYKDIIKQMERDMLQISDEVFRGFFDSPLVSGRFWHPSMDIFENDTHLLVKVEIAGVKVDEVQVSLSSDDRTLTISGIRREGEKAHNSRLSAHQLEIYCGPFGRSITLPHTDPIDRDAVSANYKDGILTISVPKLANTNKKPTRLIPIETENVAANSSETTVPAEFVETEPEPTERQN